ncbi:short-chain fatty acids transporter [Cryobacterium roopkundense]|uniref:Short-chain fatty acids transporter n=1 Tax=Cryobacterium roopkundense TaxID=1001240 RepID=A0A7W9E2D5_9MICO|nr:short-chain fatty acids transporter [Cryobacterium roopkundense]
MSTVTEKRATGPVAAFMRPINTLVERYIPSALVFVIVLTIVVAILALALTDAGPVDVIRSWGDGLAGLLAFMTQMALVLLLGHALANTSPVHWLLTRLGGIPRTPLQAYVFVFVVASLASLITWGLGLVVGGLLAKEVAAQSRARGVKLHFPLLVAAGYSGFVVWHMGYSGSGPLTAATEGSFLAEQLGRTIPLSDTMFSPWNIAAAGATIVVVAPALALVAPKRNAPIFELDFDAREKAVAEEEVVTPADKLDASRILTLLVGLALVAYLVIHFSEGGTLTLDIVNWSFLALIFLLVRNPFELIRLTKDAASNVGDILLQFPLYAGIRTDRCVLGLLRECLHPSDVRADGPARGRARELLRALRRWTVRRAGTDHARCRRTTRRRPLRRHHGCLLRGPVDQHDPAVLGPAAARDRRAQDAGHSRVHDHHLPRGRPRVLRHYADRRRGLKLRTLQTHGLRVVGWNYS